MPAIYFQMVCQKLCQNNTRQGDLFLTSGWPQPGLPQLPAQVQYFGIGIGALAKLRPSKLAMGGNGDDQGLDMRKQFWENKYCVLNLRPGVDDES